MSSIQKALQKYIGSPNRCCLFHKTVCNCYPILLSWFYQVISSRTRKLCVCITIGSLGSLNTTAQPSSEGAFRRSVWGIIRSQLLILVVLIAPRPCTFMARLPFDALIEDVFQGIVTVRSTTTVETGWNVHDFLSPSIVPEIDILAAVSSISLYYWENIRPPVSPGGTAMAVICSGHGIVAEVRSSWPIFLGKNCGANATRARGC